MESERKALLRGLKHNLEELQKAYQLPILTGTVSKKHKMKLEELKQPESVVSTLGTPPTRLCDRRRL
jgi:hypothetical protein